MGLERGVGIGVGMGIQGGSAVTVARRNGVVRVFDGVGGGESEGAGGRGVVS